VTSIREKEKLFRLTRRFPDDGQIKVKFKKYKNMIANLIKKCKTDYYSERILQHSEKNDTKKVWSTIGEIINRKRKHNTINEIDYLGETLKTAACPVRVANVFNDHFLSVGRCLAERIEGYGGEEVLDCINSPFRADFSDFRSVDSDTVVKMIESLRGGSSPGFDGVTVEILKQNIDVLARPLTHMINVSLRNGFFPEVYKTTYVTPIYKAGDRKAVTNYRPISLTSNISKIFEKIVKLQLNEYLSGNNILNSGQFGFREGMGTEDALAKLTSAVYGALDSGRKCLGIFVDLRKAFDSLSHAKLMSRLQSVGIHNTVGKWFKTYLTDRTQRVKIGGRLSDVGFSTFGVPQGTVLGPVLFLLYVNQIFQTGLGSELISYADDTVILVEGESWREVSHRASADITLLKRWFDSSLLSLNVDKTNFVTFALRRVALPDDVKIVIHGAGCLGCSQVCDGCSGECRELARVQSVKYLGIIVDQLISWKEHINSTVERIRKMYYVFYDLRDVLGGKTMLSVYYAMIHSIIRYGIVSWGGAYDNALHPLGVAQRGVLKIILRKRRDFSTVELFSLFPVPRPNNMFKFTAICQLIKSILNNEFIPEFNVGPRMTGYIRIPRQRTTAGQKYYLTQAIKWYNELSPKLKYMDGEDFVTFKKRLKKIMYA
jgi:hypothetical protein